MTHRLLRPSTREVADDLSLGTFERVATANGVLSLVDPGTPTFTRATNAFLNGAEVALGTPRYPYGRNLFTRNQSDGGEDGTTEGWGIGGTNTLASSTGQVWQGSRSIQSTYQDDLRLAIIGAKLPDASRVTITVRVFIPTDWDGGAIVLGDDGTWAGKISASGNNQTTMKGSWVTLDWSFTPDPADLSGAVIIRASTAPTAGKFVYFDGLQLEQGDTASPWRPGGPSAILIEEGTTNLLPAAQADALTAEYRTGALTGIHTLSSEVGTVKAHPEWGHGGSGIAKNAASAPIIDLDYLGASKVLWLPGAAGNSVSTPDDASLDITGDIDLRAEVALEDWTPSANQALIAKYDGTTSSSFTLIVMTNGALHLAWKDSAAGHHGVSSAGTGLADGSVKWVRVTLDVDNGASGHDVKFYTSDDDGLTWTQLGSTSTTAGVTDIQASTFGLSVGSYSDNNTNPVKGKALRAQVRNGIDGTLVADFNAADFASPGTTAVDSTGKTWTINRSGDATAEIVDRNTWAFTGSEFLTMPDRDDLDFGANAAFTVASSFLTRTTLASGSRFFEKRDAIGYVLYHAVTGVEMYVQDASGSVGPRASGGELDGGYHVVAGARATDGQVSVRLDGGTSVNGPTLRPGDLSTAAVAAVGATSTAGSQMRGLIPWLVLFRRTLTAAEHTELAGWDGTVATEPTWLRDEATLYVNADDPVQRAMYRAHNTVVNLASGGIGSVLTMQPADNHAIWMEPATSPQRVQLEKKEYKTSWHTGGATRNNEGAELPIGVLPPTEQEGTLELDVFVTQRLKDRAPINQPNFFNSRTSTNGVVYLVRLDPSVLTFYVGSAGASAALTNLPLGHCRIAMKWGSFGVRGWVNGVEVASTLTVSEARVPVNAFLASFNTGSSHLGEAVDGLRISNRSRTDTELADWRAPLEADVDTTYLMTFEGNLVYGAGGRRVSPTYPLVDMHEVTEIVADITSTGAALDVEASLDGGTTWDTLDNITAPIEHDDVAFRYSLYALNATAGPAVSSASYSLSGEEWYDTTPTSDLAYDALGPLTEQDASTGYHLLRYVDALVRQLDEVEKLSRDTPDFAGWGRLLDLAQTQDDALPWLAQFVGVQTLRELTPESQRIRIGEAAGWRRGTKAAIRGAMRQYLTGSRTTQIFERYQGFPYRLRVRTFENETPDPAQVEAAVRALKPAGLVLTYDVSPGQSYDELNAAHADYDAVKAAYPTYDDALYGIPPEV